MDKVITDWIKNDGGFIMTNFDQQLPQFPEPYWLDSTRIPTFQKLEEDIQTDIAIVGGGITGITAAYLLSQQGIASNPD